MRGLNDEAPPKELLKKIESEFDQYKNGATIHSKDCYISFMNFCDDSGVRYPMAPILSGPHKVGGVISMLQHAIRENVPLVRLSMIHHS